MKRRLDLADERGTTLVELMVGLMVGMVVLSTLTVVIVVTLHGSARVSARVDATQRGRVVVTRIMQQLHSACIAPKTVPIQADSTGTSLKFTHASGSEGAAVAPKPTLTEISLSNGVLAQTDWASTGTTPPAWISPATRQLMTNVSPISPSSSIFSYYAYTDGTISETPQATPLEAGAASTIMVRVALTTSPGRTPVADSGAAASIQDSATLRLTPPSFNEQATSRPCQ